MKTTSTEPSHDRKGVEENGDSPDAGVPAVASEASSSQYLETAGSPEPPAYRSQRTVHTVFAVSRKPRAVRRFLPLLLIAAMACGGVLYYRSPSGRKLANRTVTMVAARSEKIERWATQNPVEEAFVPTTSVRKGPFDVSLVAVGALKAEESLPVSIETYGTVVWTVEDGTRVKKGDLLLQLQNEMQVRQLQERDTALVNAKQKLEDTKRDRTLEWQNANTQHQKAQQEFEILQAQNKSAIEQAEAQLQYQNTELALARVQYSKNQRLAEEKLVPQTQVDADAAGVKAKEFAYEKAKGDLDLKKGQLASNELQKKQEVDRLKFAADMAKGRIDSELKNAQLNVDTIKKQREDLIDQIKKSVITAPSDGIVVLATRWDGSGGQRPIRPGDQVGRNQKVCELPNISRMQVSLEVEQKDIGPIRVGLPVRIRLDPFPDQVYHGTVSRVASMAKASQVEGAWFDANKNTFTTIIDIKDSDPERLRPGMNATLEIYSSRLDRVTYIPLEALFRQNDRSIAYLQVGERFRAVPLKVGSRNKDKIVVKKGLRPGQRIALVPPPAALILKDAPAPRSGPAPKGGKPKSAGDGQVAGLPRR
jgi:HlyD family secretion protein